MKKQLILVLALAMVAGLAFGAYAEVQNVKVSGDITAYGLSRQLGLTSQRAENTFASIMRLRVDADLTDNVSTTVRLINERYWGNETQNTNTTTDGQDISDNNTNIDLDLAYVTMKEFFYSPLTLTVGRQELHFGNDMIIGDPYTNNAASKASVFSKTIDADLSMRKSFDSIRATLDYNPLVLDVVAAQIKKNSRTQPNGTTQSLSVDDQETLYGINANYAVNKNTTLEGYIWQRRIGKKTTSTNNKIDRTNVVGGRVVTNAITNLTYQLEAAYQFGTKVNAATVVNSTQKRSAWGIETGLTYDLKDVKQIEKYKPTVSALYAYFSGNRGGKTNRAWDPMYENQKYGDIANALFNQSNVMLAGGIVTAKPMDDLTLKGEYYAYWWDKRFNDPGVAQATATGEALVMTHDKMAGQEVDLSLTYDYTEDVQFGLLGGLLFPASSFNKQNRNTAGEVIGSMKVTF